MTALLATLAITAVACVAGAALLSLWGADV